LFEQLLRFTFLGYRIIREMGRNNKMAPKVEIPKEAMKRFREKIREMTAPRTSNESAGTKIIALNQFIRGWCQYYRCTSSPSRAFNHLKNEIYWDMAHWLGRKYKINMPEIMQRYKEGSTFRTKNIKLVMPTEYKAKKLRTTTWHNPYTAKEAVTREKLFSYLNLWSGNETRQGWEDLREEVILLKGTTCYLCGTTLHHSEVEIDHVPPRKRFKDIREADRMKHLQPICTSCHRAKTKTDLRVLSRTR
jgi:5-methylcytosine-specific restriction endonuclease McrA